jgi:hypothetical protein
MTTIEALIFSMKDAYEEEIVPNFCHAFVYLANLEGPYNDDYDMLPNLPELYQFSCSQFITQCVERDLIHQVHLNPIKERLEMERKNYTAFIYFLFAIFARKTYLR